MLTFSWTYLMFNCKYFIVAYHVVLWSLMATCRNGSIQCWFKCSWLLCFVEYFGWSLFDYHWEDVGMTFKNETNMKSSVVRSNFFSSISGRNGSASSYSTSRIQNCFSRMLLVRFWLSGVPSKDGSVENLCKGRNGTLPSFILYAWVISILFARYSEK